MNASPFASIVLITVMLASIGLPQNSSPRKVLSQDQSEFGAEEDFVRPTPVPDEILQTIRRMDKAPPDELPANWLVASAIHLKGPEEIDLVVKGVGGLALPHAALFWIFRKTQESYELVLATGGDSLTIRRLRSKGFREISVTNLTQAGRQSTTTIYRFDGQRYKEYKSKLETR
jgi:hypothetical protein